MQSVVHSKTQHTCGPHDGAAPPRAPRAPFGGRGGTPGGPGRRPSAGRLIGAALVTASLAASAAAEERAGARAPEDREFVPAYLEPETADYQVYYTELRRAHFLESVAQELNHVLTLPATVTLRIAECGHSTTSWVADTQTVTVCYEFLDAVLAIASEAAPSPERAEQLFSGAVTFGLFAEVGQALVSVYRLPVEKGPLQAGDEFAAITLAAAEQDGDGSAAAAVEFFDDALTKPGSGFEYLDTHGFDRARLETVACILYGNAPLNHAGALARGILSTARAPRCAEEMVAAAKAWDLYLKNHTRVPPVLPAPPAPPAPPVPPAAPAQRL